MAQEGRLIRRALSRGSVRTWIPTVQSRVGSNHKNRRLQSHVDRAESSQLTLTTSEKTAVIQSHSFVVAGSLPRICC